MFVRLLSFVLSVRRCPCRVDSQLVHSGLAVVLFQPMVEMALVAVELLLAFASDVAFHLQCWLISKSEVVR